jgi:hypothetical protein
MRRLAAVIGGLLLVPLVPAPASAHLIGGGIEPSNYQSRILAVRPALPAGVSISLVNGGTRLKLGNGGAREAVVLDPDGAPLLRVAPGTTASWNDLRTHWAAAQEAPPAVRRAPGRAQVVIPRWTVRLRYGAQLVEVIGDVRFVPGPPPLLWLGLAALLAICVVAAGGAAFWRHALAAVLAAVVAIDLLHTAGAWAGVDAPLLASLLASSISLIGWAVALLSIRQLLRGRSESGLFQLLLAVGLIAIVGGLSDLGTLLRSQVATALPEDVARAAVAAKIGLGVGAIAAALLRLRVVLRPDEPDEDDEDDEDEPDEETRHAQLFAR